jgi:hypothetical protein
MRFIRISGVLALVALVIAVPSALALAFNDSSYNQPNGVVGMPYSFTFSARGGCPPYHYAIINGNFPPGLTLGTDTGVISGTPTTPGSYSYWVDLYDTGPPEHSTCTVSHAQREFTINITAGLKIQTASVPVGTVGVAYNLTLAVDPGVTATWRLAKGSLPDGLNLGTNGVISGTPSKAGSFAFSVIATDTGNGRTAGASYTLTILDPLTLTVAPPPATVTGASCLTGEFCGEVGMTSPITITPTATGGNVSGPYKWTVAPQLPLGLTIDPASGVITGIPKVAGAYPLTLTVADVDGRTQSANVTVKVAAKLAIVRSQHIGPVKARKRFSVKLQVDGGAAPIVWRAAAGRFPIGVQLDPKTGILSGVAKKGGRYRFILEASDTLGAKSVRGYLLIVKAPPAKVHHKKKKT